MHILYFYQYYSNPDCATTARHYALIRHIARHHAVTVITTRSYYEARLTNRFPWVPEGVNLHMLDIPYHNAMGARQRMQAYGMYTYKALFRSLRIGTPDLIFGSSTPLTAAWAAHMAARIKRIPWIFEVRDLWPDFPIQMGAVPSLWLQRRLYALEHTLYKSAAHVITLSPDMEAHVKRHGIPSDHITTIGHGSDFDLLGNCTAQETQKLRSLHHLEGKKVFLYGGTFGRANDIPTLLAAAERCAHREDIHFVFAGYGYDGDTIQKAAKDLNNVLLLPAQPRHRMLCWFKVADCTLVSFINKPVLATNAPAKLFDSLSAGTPVIVTNPGWTKTLVETHHCGWYVPPSDPDRLALQIKELSNSPEALITAGRQALKVAQGQFDRRVLAERMNTLFEQVAQRHLRQTK